MPSTPVTPIRTPRRSAVHSAMQTPVRHSNAKRVPATPKTPALPSSSDLRQSYEDYMKIVADNKINAANSWNVALIDYFKDMRVLRDGDSINFQKASCTLDGCVKIYSSRVDSVEGETKKLLNGLADRGNASTADGGDAEEGATKKRTSTRSGNTLAKDPSAINIKEFDFDVAIDPLFKKTCADFDEGGARGLLLNHLFISSEGRIVLDAGDATMTSIASEVTSLDDELKVEKIKIEDTEIDLRRIKENFWGGLKNIWERDLCPSLKDFKFNSKDMPTLNSDLFKLADLSENWQSNFDDDDEDDGGQVELPFDENLEVGFVSRFDDFGDAVVDDDSDIESIKALVEPVVSKIVVTEESSESYFDQAIVKSWAGPEHWKPRRVRPVKTMEKVVKEARKTRKKKEPILDFTADPVDLKLVFATSKASIDLPKPKIKPPSTLLPEDYHFSADTLLTLFTNPYRKINVKSRGVLGAKKPDGAITHEEVDIQPENTVPGGEPATYFYNDDLDDDDDDDEIEAPSGDVADIIQVLDQLDLKEEQEEIVPYDANKQLDFGDQLVSQLKKTRALAPLNFARTAKRVDVKKLKDNIWNEITQNVEVNPFIDDQVGVQEQPFTGVISRLTRRYPPKTMNDISVAFCFICTLHLANEKNLVVETADGAEEWRGKELVIKSGSNY